MLNQFLWIFIQSNWPKFQYFYKVSLKPDPYWPRYKSKKKTRHSRQTDRQTDRQKVRQRDRQTDRQTDRQKNRQTDRQTDRETVRQIDRERETDIQIRDVRNHSQTLTIKKINLNLTRWDVPSLILDWGKCSWHRTGTSLFKKDFGYPSTLS